MAVAFTKEFLYICFPLILKHVLGEQSVQEDLPVLNYTFETGPWQHISNISSIKSPVLYSPDSEATLSLKCVALYPITWNLTGFVSHLQAVDIFTIAGLRPPNFAINLYFYNYYQPLASSLRISCESLKDWEKRSELFVFIRSKNENPFINSGNTTVMDSSLIPCATTNPTPWAAPILYKKGVAEHYKEVRSPAVIFHPTEGFRSFEVFNGTYICKQGLYNITITAVVSGEYIVSPRTDTVFAFSDESIVVECFSLSYQPLQISVIPFQPETIKILQNDANNKAITQIEPICKNAVGIKGNAKCHGRASGQLSKSLVVKEWQFEFFQSPQLTLVEHQVICVHETPLEMLQIVKCDTHIACNFRFRCFENVTFCNIDYQLQFHSNASSVREDKKYLIKLVYPHYAGLARCTLKGISRTWDFFTSLESRKYSNWQEANPAELVRFVEEKTEDIRFSNFTCDAVAYLFVNYMEFEVKFKNGSKHLLESNGSTVNISNPLTSDKNIVGLNVVGTLTLKIPPDTVAIYCHAIWSNSTMSMTASIDIMTPDSNVDESKPIDSKVIYIAALGITLAILAVVTILFYRFWKKNKDSSRNLRKMTDKEVDDFFHGGQEVLKTRAKNQMECVEFLPYNMDFEIPLKDLEFAEGNFLGRGHFSYVVRGKVLSKELPVAIKVSLESEDLTLFKSLLSEVKIMIYIGKHENVLTLVGVCTDHIKNRSIYIVTELCESGSLKSFLRKSRSVFINLMNVDQELDKSLLQLTAAAEHESDVITTLDLIGFAAQIANGMDYLSSKAVVHADLAARNVLLTKNKVIKISDFGLSRKIYENRNYVKTSKTPVPWRWLAIETLNTLTFSTASDVWAYGVTLFEIFTLGDTPFPNEEWNKAFNAKLESGMRLNRPNYSTPEIYTKMMACWDSEPVNRPAFASLKVSFEAMVNKYSNNTANINVIGLGATESNAENDGIYLQLL